MLCLTRKVGEEIVVDDVIRIKVLSIVGNKTRIGITAPDSVRVDRKEIHDAIHAGEPATVKAGAA